MTQNQASRGKWWILGIATALIVLLIGIFSFYQKIHKDPVSARRFDAPIPVKVIIAQKSDLSYTIGASGISKEFSAIKLISKIDAPIKAVKVNTGDLVAKNHVLLEYDGTVLLSERKSAEVNLKKALIIKENSGINYERIGELYKQKLVAKVDLERAQQEYYTALSSYEKAQYDFSSVEYSAGYLSIKSPVKGVVLERTADPGEVPPLKSELFTLGVIDPILMEARIPEQNVGDVIVGKEAEVVFDAYPNLIFHGKVSKVSVTVDPATRTFAAYVSIPNTDYKLKTGLTGFNRIVFQKEALAVPSLSVINPTGQRATVFVVDDDNIAHLREIKIGTSTQEYTEIQSGLAEGERVISIGMRGLRDGDRVRVVEKVF